MKPVLALILVCIIAVFAYVALMPEFQPEPLPKSAIPVQKINSCVGCQSGVGGHGVIVVFQ